MLYFHLQGCKLEKTQIFPNDKVPLRCAGRRVWQLRRRSVPALPGRGAEPPRCPSPWCWNSARPLPCRDQPPAPAGGLRGFSQAEFPFWQEKTTSPCCTRALRGEGGKYSCNTAAVLFYEEMQPILYMQVKCLKIVVNSSSGKASFFKATENLQGSLRR